MTWFCLLRTHHELCLGVINDNPHFMIRALETQSRESKFLYDFVKLKNPLKMAGALTVERTVSEPTCNKRPPPFPVRLSDQESAVL